ncbi:MAG: c-type cytochrome [Planctomycetaceae bacterium]|nr:c-type cytochrome [Planctomycetaceae bacterium]
MSSRLTQAASLTRVIIKHGGKRLLLASLASVCLLLCGRPSVAQSLTDKLSAEDPANLAAEARASGNIVRGAILFHQGNINCAKCHRPTAASERLGPDLSRIEPTATDAYLIESILQPSKSIKAGFESSMLLTKEGQVYSGIILREDAEQITIRDVKNLDQPFTVQRANVDELKPATVSSMPANLADELKDRQQFLDLLRYVMDLKERGPEETAQPTASVVRELAPELHGLVEIQRRNCIACHGADDSAVNLTPKKAPDLNWSGRNLNPEWMERFIRDPHLVKPGTTMPTMVSANHEDRSQIATAITHFLVGKSGNQFTAQAIDANAAASGKELFHTVGCVACHVPRNQDGSERPLADSQALGDLSTKYNVTALVEFLEDPVRVRASGHMPNMRLTHREAIDIANFLLQSTPTVVATWELDPDLAEAGRSLFVQNNCHQCHKDVVEAIEPARKYITLDQANPTHGCLSQTAGDWPDFSLSDLERTNIRAALASLSTELTPAQRIDVSLQSFNCLACHERDQLGGVSSLRNPHFQTTNLNLGEQGRIPPRLTGVGAKLKPQWLREVLVTGRTIRPYMKTRMPQYGVENIEHLIDLFQTVDQLPETKFAEFHEPEVVRKKGLELAGTNGLNCVSCHTYQYKLSDTMPAVDLTEMADRLEKDWFYQYMLAPQKFSPNTVMPSFWPRGVAVRKDLEGSAEEQIEALWQYLLDGRQAPMPQGVVREPLRIVVAEEAQMLRRSYPGIGKRGIGVGYPGGVNLAFDAEQLRLHALWTGGFADPGGVWTGQGAGNVHPLGRPIEFSKGPDLDDQQRPWIVDEGRPPQHQFQGYLLDDAQRPTFRYVFDSVEVQDYFQEAIDESNQQTHLRRTLILHSPNGRKQLRFRIASADRIVKHDQDYAVGDRLKVRLLTEQQPVIVTSESNGQSLELHFDLPAGDGAAHGLAEKQATKLVIEYRWEAKQ